MATPLDGIRVIDFSHALGGPYCTKLLADYGADVYKIESPDGGDIGRTWGPPFRDGESCYFMGVNAGKRSVAIDLKKPGAVDLCLDMIEHADVVIENMRPGTIERPEWIADPRFATNPDRVRNRAVLEPMIAEVFRGESCVSWMAKLRAHGVPCTPVRTLDQVAADPQTAFHETFPPVDGGCVTGRP